MPRHEYVIYEQVTTYKTLLSESVLTYVYIIIINPVYFGGKYNRLYK